MTRKIIIKLLTEYGHSAAMALRIAIDYERGDVVARDWVRIVKEST